MASGTSSNRESTVVYEGVVVDRLLMEGMAQAQHLQNILQLEKRCLQFITESKEKHLEFPECVSSYVRLLHYKIADFFKLVHVSTPSGNGRVINFFKTPSTFIPKLNLSQLFEIHCRLHQPKVVLKRRDAPLQLLAAQLPPQQSPQPELTADQRQEQYESAKADIFNQEDTDENNNNEEPVAVPAEATVLHGLEDANEEEVQPEPEDMAQFDRDAVRMRPGYNYPPSYPQPYGYYPYPPFGYWPQQYPYYPPQ